MTSIELTPSEVLPRLAEIDRELTAREEREQAVWGTHDAQGFTAYQRTVPPSPVREAGDVALGSTPGLVPSQADFRRRFGIEDRGMEESNAERSANKRDMMRGQR